MSRKQPNPPPPSDRHRQKIMKGKYLITTDNWFFAADGQLYRAAWGEVEIIEDSFLGVKTNRNATNWFAKVGGNDREVIIAGCQIHYAIKCPNKPDTSKPFKKEMEHDGKSVIEDAPTRIYITE